MCWMWKADEVLEEGALLTWVWPGQGGQCLRLEGMERPHSGQGMNVWISTESVSVKSSHYSFFLSRMILLPYRDPTNIRWLSPSLVAIQHCVSRLLVHLHLSTPLTEFWLLSLVSVFMVFSPSQVSKTQLYRPQQLWLQANMMVPSFVCGYTDPNSDSHDCVASTLPRELSLQSLAWIF